MNRKVLSISFTNQDYYNHVNKQPNKSFYINDLIRKDIEGERENKRYIDKKIEELKQYIDRKTREPDMEDDLKINLLKFF